MQKEERKLVGTSLTSLKVEISGSEAAMDSFWGFYCMKEKWRQLLAPE